MALGMEAGAVVRVAAWRAAAEAAEGGGGGAVVAAEDIVRGGVCLLKV